MNVRCALLLSVVLLVAFISTIAAPAPGVSASSARSLASAAGLSQEKPCDGLSTAGEAVHHAGIVIVFPDGTDTYCIPFEGDELSGIEMLERTGLPLVLSGFGGLGAGVCSIDDLGCNDPGDCFCQCRSGACSYWSSYELTNGEWRYLQVGASQYRANDGDVVGWVWSNGRSAPGPSSIAAICPSARPTPVPTPAPTSTPAAQPSPPQAPPVQSVATATRSAPPPGAPLAQAVQTPARATVQPAASPTATNERVDARAAVLRQSTRPTPEAETNDAATTPQNSGSGPPTRLLAFAALVTGLVVVGGVLVVRRRLDDK